MLPFRQISRQPHWDCPMCMGGKTIARSHILCNLAVAPKLELQSTHMQLCTCHNGAGRVMLQASLMWKTIYELHGIQHHANKNNSWNTFKRKGMMDRTSLLLEKINILFHQIYMFRSCSQIQDWSGREGCDLIHNPSKLSITSYFNIKPLQSIYIWYIMCIVAQTSLILWLIRCVTVMKQIFLLYIIKKIWLLTKKISTPMQTFCWSCSSSSGTFTKLCGLWWPVSLTVLFLSFRTETPQNLLGTLALSTVMIQPPSMPQTQSTASKLAFDGYPNVLYRWGTFNAHSICHLVNSFILSATAWKNTLLPIGLLKVVDMQQTWMHIKDHIRET